MRHASPFFLAFAALCTASIALGAAADRSPDEEYKARVHEILYPALLSQLAQNHVTPTVSFSLTIDRRGRLDLLQVGSAPKNRAAEEIAAKVIRSLRFPPPPKRVMGDHDLILINSEVKPKRK
jgi:outer membrane biosynthesis protein TonB